MASDPETAASARTLVGDAAEREDWPEMWYTAGLHPHEASRWNPSVRGRVEEELGREAVAVGEIGLDFHYDNSPRRAQRSAFAEQLAIAIERDLPVVVHSRDAEEDTLAVLEESRVPPARVVLHCFTGSLGMLNEAVGRGYYVSLSGIATFGSFDAAEIVPRVPEERLLVETDAPYLAPVPHRGRRNEPAFLPDTLEALARFRGVSLVDLAAATRQNARAFYRLD